MKRKIMTKRRSKRILALVPKRTRKKVTMKRITGTRRISRMKTRTRRILRMKTRTRSITMKSTRTRVMPRS